MEAFPTDRPYDLALYGDEGAIRAELEKLPAADLPISVVHCTQDIEMGEKPASAIKNKKDSPIVRAMADQRAGKVHAVVSAGSTGAMVAASGWAPPMPPSPPVRQIFPRRSSQPSLRARPAKGSCSTRWSS